MKRLSLLCLLLCSFVLVVAQSAVPAWKARWIGIGYNEEKNSSQPQYFRKAFSLGKKVKKATAWITARGIYEAYINGQRIGDSYLTPGWTSYNNQHQFQQYDVTALLQKGGNSIDAMVGNGWYRGKIGWGDNMGRYGNRLGLLLQLEITYTDGRTTTIVTDESWQSGKGPSVFAEIYDGETIDHRISASGWSPVTLEAQRFDNLVPAVSEPVRKKETFTPIKILRTPKGEQVIDFGQNLTGWVIVKASGPAGAAISIDHGEVLDKQGNFYNENLRVAKAQANYILSGQGEEVFEPHFTFYGFRYIRVNGYPGELKPENFTAVALYSDMKPAGTFECSNPLLNQLQHNITWGQRGNFVDVPTDCPQRDERLGWTGDAQAFFRTATFNFNVKNFFTKWLRDVAAEQDRDGQIPFVVPDVLKMTPTAEGGAAGWADVATIIPWQLYEVYGDRALLQSQYPMMQKWVDYLAARVNEQHLLKPRFQFGDWLSYRSPHDEAAHAITDNQEIANCFYAHSLQNLINAAGVLGKTDDVARYKIVLDTLKSSFLKEYVTPNGRLMSNTQTAYVLALHFDMLPESMRPMAAQRLVDNIKRYDMHLTTGFLGTPYLCHVLTRFGYPEVAYALLRQESYPSWLYPVKMGATTIWERWDGIKPDGEFQTVTMNSFNHYAYGAIGDWMYRNTLGIQPLEPGYKKIQIKPVITESKLTYAKGSYETAYGKIASSWRIEGGKLTLSVEIPAGTTAEVYVPDTSGKQYSKKEVGPGKYEWTAE
ncbi:MAG: family 78 glycoside hydrolase catalytic domain [Candidatus Pseudobacter hemicellulosilyticus]|uniref:alpha-L-rhamnosidase n=1 Tax=Candidatus Pseudobacter hemicellulosilyticus TaxID=3121375 RepID=A0AAJ5WQ27_9BACT|nr:MAG: family 78 glycoside hydrolase catalytic domain [Pseudobacter sp.]